MRHVNAVAFAAVVIAGLGAVVGTIWIGSQVKEQTVVADPYEEGLRHDAERHAREALGWDVALPGRLRRRGRRRSRSPSRTGRAGRSRARP